MTQDNSITFIHSPPSYMYMTFDVFIYTKLAHIIWRKEGTPCFQVPPTTFSLLINLPNSALIRPKDGSKFKGCSGMTYRGWMYLSINRYTIPISRYKIPIDGRNVETKTPGKPILINEVVLLKRHPFLLLLIISIENPLYSLFSILILLHYHDC